MHHIKIIVIVIYFLPFFYTLYKLSIPEHDETLTIYRKQLIWYYGCVFIPLFGCYYLLK